MSDNRIKAIVILGGDVIAWSAALALSRNLSGQGISITVVDGAASVVPDSAESSLANMRGFLGIIGLGEEALVRHAQATFKLGNRYQLLDGHKFTHPFGTHGVTSELVEFNHSALKLRLEGDLTPFEAYSLAAVAGNEGKFLHPAADRNSILSTLAYGLQFDSKLYTADLRENAKKLGVSHIQQSLQDVVLDPTTGYIKSLVLDCDAETSGPDSIKADLFIDCSGTESLLLGKALNVPYEDWSHWLPFNRALSVWSDDIENLSLTSLTQLATGWCKKVPLRNRTYHEFIFCQEETHGEEIPRQIQELLALKITSAPQIRKLLPGRRRELWSKNCIALGEAACNPGFLAVSSLDIAQSAITRLLDYFPSRECKPLNTVEFNRITGEEIDRVRDFHLLHYHVQSNDLRYGEKFLAAGLPLELIHKLNVFKACGRLALYEEEMIAPNSWISFLLSAGIWPTSYDPLADVEPLDNIITLHNRIKRLIADTVKKMPEQSLYLHQLLAIKRTQKI